MRSAVTASAGTARALQPALDSVWASISADSVSISLRAPMHSTVLALGASPAANADSDSDSDAGVGAGCTARKSSSTRLTPLTTRCRWAAVASRDEGVAARASIGTALSL